MCRDFCEVHFVVSFSDRLFQAVLRPREGSWQRGTIIDTNRKTNTSDIAQSPSSTAQSRSSSPSRGSVDISRVSLENQLNLEDSSSSHKSLIDIRQTLNRSVSVPSSSICL